MVFVLTALFIMGAFLAALKKMSNRIVPVLLISVVLAVTNASAASPKPMSNSEIRTQLFGKLLTGEYPNGLAWAERFNSDGTTDYSENARAIRGIMTLNGNILCFTYQQDSGTTGGCFEVWQRGKNCFDFYGATANFPTATLQDRRQARAWDARGWIEGQESTCVSNLIS